MIGLSRRAFIVGLGAVAAAPGAALAHPHPVAAPRVVGFRTRAAPGSIVVRTAERRLYFVLGRGQAVEYVIGVGRAGRSFRGSGTIARKAKWPRWTPTRNMIRREPHKYARFAGGVPGGPGNPLGARCSTSIAAGGTPCTASTAPATRRVSAGPSPTAASASSTPTSKIFTTARASARASMSSSSELKP